MPRGVKGQPREVEHLYTRVTTLPCSCELYEHARSLSLYLCPRHEIDGERLVVDALRGAP